MERRIKVTWTRTVTNTAVLTEDEAREYFGTADVLELPGKMLHQPADLNEMEYDGPAEGVSQVYDCRADGAETEYADFAHWLYEDKDKPLAGTERAWERTGPFHDADEAFEHWASH